MAGIAIAASTMRIMIASTAPPRYPAAAPHSEPRTAASRPAAAPTSQRHLAALP